MSDSQMIEQANMMLQAFGEAQVPMIGYCEPVLTDISDDSCTVNIPLQKKTMNHLHSMYFGALNVGADCAGGFLAMHHIQKSGEMLSLVFKSCESQYLKRPQGDTHFHCESGQAIAVCVKKCIETGERHHTPLKITATVPSVSNEPVAIFNLELSLKKVTQ